MNGSVAIAKEMVDAAARPFDARKREPLPEYRWDSVKLCKRDLEYELARSAETAEYEGRNSFGETYGEHRRALELSWDEHRAIYDYATDQGMDVGITLCAPTLVDELNFEPAFLKLASRDLSNLPLIRRMAATHFPLVISTGMHGPETLGRAIEEITRYHGSLEHTVVLHCLSSYPADPSDLNLRTIQWLQSHFPDARVGYSDHTVGLTMGPVAVGLGATWIEKHISLYRGMKGSDHAGALGPRGIWRFARDVRQTVSALGEPAMIESEEARSARRKLERSICSSSDLQAGTVLGSSNTVLLSPGTGIPWTGAEAVFGRELAQDIPAKTVLSSTMLEEAA